MTARLLTLSKVIEQQLWEFEHPLRQFRELRPEVLNRLEQGSLSLESLRELHAKEIGKSFLFRTSFLSLFGVVYHISWELG